MVPHLVEEHSALDTIQKTYQRSQGPPLVNYAESDESSPHLQRMEIQHKSKFPITQFSSSLCSFFLVRFQYYSLHLESKHNTISPAVNFEFRSFCLS